MSVIIDKETGNLIIEYPCDDSPSDQYRFIFDNLLELLKNQDRDLFDIDVNYWVIKLLQSLIPNDEQAKRMFAAPCETQQVLSKLKEEIHKNDEKIKFFESLEASKTEKETIQATPEHPEVKNQESPNEMVRNDLLDLENELDEKPSLRKLYAYKKYFQNLKT